MTVSDLDRGGRFNRLDVGALHEPQRPVDGPHRGQQHLPPVEADINQYLRVTATYTDGHGAGKTLMHQVRLLPGLETTINVTLPDGSRERVYRLLLGQWNRPILPRMK